MALKMRGWYGESNRHSLARRGIKTVQPTFKDRPNKIDFPKGKGYYFDSKKWNKLSNKEQQQRVIFYYITSDKYNDLRKLYSDIPKSKFDETLAISLYKRKGYSPMMTTYDLEFKGRGMK